MTHGLGMWLRGEVLVRQVWAWGWFLDISKAEGEKRTRLELLKALSPRCLEPREGLGDSESARRGKKTRGRHIIGAGLGA